MDTAAPARPLAHEATVLLVDDDADVRDALSRLLRSAGWRAEAFASAQEFVERGPLHAVGCLVLDIRMGGMDGLQLHDWMRAHDIALPVIFLSAHCDVAISVAAMKHGAVDVLQKPADADELLQAISAAVQHSAREHRQRSALEAISARIDTLSRREREVMDQVVAGRLNKQIGAQLGITEKTVKVHRARALAKMQVRSVAQLVHACDQVRPHDWSAQD